MPFVLTTASVVQCSHHALVTLESSQSKLKAGGSPVLVATDLVGAKVVACPNIGTNLKPCTSTLSVASGTSTKLSVDNQPVLLQTAQGPTDSTPPGVWTVTSAAQSALSAS
jgi:hypothetical protein